MFCLPLASAGCPPSNAIHLLGTPDFPWGGGGTIRMNYVRIDIDPPSGKQ
jgi:hypothetical protein